MEFEVYQEDDDVLRKRVRLALHKTYSLAEAISLSNRLNLFDTLDGYRVTLIKERDPVVFAFEHPILHVSTQAQRGSDAIIPKTEAGWVSLAARLLVRFGLGSLVGATMQAQSKGQAVHVWFMVEEWADQPTHRVLVKSH